ncbi:hypothetical protein QAD02_007303 [Eretmocerus hayati]|uniref:Uncharacterized protein n=1 Tax=Eretmocerus hayati TaxID=131215 RepID=A0ACC2N442_9HYME|nr:hypothetical protein QAD02_007303 [Eretmocerus hayati]
MLLARTSSVERRNQYQVLHHRRDGWKWRTKCSIETLSRSLANSVLGRVLQYNRSIDNNSHLLQFYSKNTGQKLSLQHQAIPYSGDRSYPTSFLGFCKETSTAGYCDYISKITAQQSSPMSWFELKYGRITASIIYEAAVCKTTGGSLVQKVLSMNYYDNRAMESGRRLECQVRSEVQKILMRHWNGGRITTSGLILRRNFPALSASQDGLQLW